MSYSDLELFQMHADALYVHDANNRLLRINETDPDNAAPRFFLGRTLAGNLWRIRYDLPDDLAAELEQLAAAEPVVNDLHHAPDYLTKYTELLQQHAPLTNTDTGPAYYLPKLDPSTGTMAITPENMPLLRANYPYMMSKLDEHSPVEVVVADGVAVAACFTARRTTQVAEAGIYTVEAYRGRGYAVETARGWAGAIRATGRLPLYSTSWANTASQAVAMKLGAVQYGVDFSIT